MKLTLIWAMTHNRVIGRGGGLPWHLPDDLAHFKERTTGHAVLMGRKTWQTVGKPLPRRRNIVISRDPSFRAAGAEVVSSLDAALQLVAGDDEVFVTGGAEIYALALERADRLDMTLIHTELEGDTFFPALSLEGWRLVSERHHEPDERHRYAFTFRLYER